MSIQIFLEIVGYIGSFLVIISMLMTSVVKLRIINTIGSVIFCIYALCIYSYPTAAMQVCLIAINIFSLYKLNNTKKEYSAVRVKAGDGFLFHFIATYKDDIRKFFPDFSEILKNDIVFLIVCAGVPAGIFAAAENMDEMGNRQLTVKIDYTIPAYRDCSAGKFILSYLKNQGIKKLLTKTSVPVHKKYLSSIGFSFNSSADVYEKELC